jgi:lysophospholipase L1-like esterase
MKTLLFLSILSGALSAQTTVLSCVGDSIMAGYTSSPTLDPCLLTVNALNSLTGTSNYTEGYNGGTSGTTSADWSSPSAEAMQHALSSGLVSSGATAVIAMLGTNDCKIATLTPPATYQANMQGMVTTLRGLGITHIFLNYPIYIYSDPYGSWTPLSTANACLVSYRASLNAIAASDPTHVFIGDTQAYGYFQANPTGNYYDGVHPSNAGYAILANFWALGYLGLETTTASMRSAALLVSSGVVWQ